MSNLDEGDKKLLADIDKYGWHVLLVAEDEKGPGFAYTVGLYKTYNHPEIAFIGLIPDLAHILINNIGDAVKQGKVYQNGWSYPDILHNFKCHMLKVKKEHYQEYFGYGSWYYKSDDFPVLQCVYPTVKGVYPWEQNFPDNSKDLQPLLGDLNSTKSITN